LKNKLHNLIGKHVELFNFIQQYSIFGYIFYEADQNQDFYTHPSLLQHLKKYNVSLANFSFKLETESSTTSKKKHKVKIIIDEETEFIKKAKKIEIVDGNSTYILLAFHKKSIKINSPNVSIKSFSIEEKLKISQKAFSSNFENAAIGMAIISLDGTWENVNSAISNMLGYTKKELSKLTFQDITHPEDLNIDLQFLEQLIAGEIPHYHLEKRYFHKSGSLVYGILAVSIVRDDNDAPLYFISQIVDITDRKNAEKEIKKLLKTSKDQNGRLRNFAHIVSHNLRSHSGNFSMLLDILDDETDENQRAEIISHLKVAANHLGETILHLNEIVTMNNTIHDNLIAINLLKEVNSIIKGIKLNDNQLSVKINVNIPPEIKVLAIKAYLNSILMNFITNGIKYSDPNKESFLNITASKNQEFVIIEITDNGLGIDLEKHGDKIFGMYKTFHKHEDAKGIGLFIAKNQIDALNGKVTVKSKVNKGTTFKIYLKHE